MTGDDRSPVIIGIGETCDRPDTDIAALGALDLIVAAIQAAAADVGAANLIAQLDWIGIVDALSWERRPEPLHPAVVERLGIAPRSATSSPSPSGNYPIRFLEDAANAIVRGEAQVAVVAGGEAMRSFTRKRTTGTTGTEVIRTYRGAGEADVLQRYGLLTPIDVYPLYEQATRHAWGQSFEEAQAESGAIWAGNAQVAVGNPYAWIRDGRSAEAIIAPTPDNPMLSFPYTRAMVANSSVNQGAAVIVTSIGHARSLGVPAERMVHIGYGAGANESVGNLDRADFIRSPAMETSLVRTLDFNEMTIDDIDHVEFYSCFPCVPKMARRVIGWPLDRPHTIYGGLTFGGGPIGNCMTHAVAALTRRIRDGSRAGLIFANGGFATRNHSIVLRRDSVPGGRQARSYDVQKEADTLRGPLPPLLDAYFGEGRIESFSIPYADGRPRHATIVARAPTGERFLARVSGSSPVVLNWLIDPLSAPVGTNGGAALGDDGLSIWSNA